MKARRTQKIGTKSSKKGVYNKYSFEVRRKLIVMVVQEKRTLASSAKELGICQTTARLIVSTWRQEQRVFEKKSEREKRVKREAKRKAHEKRRERALKQPESLHQDTQKEEERIASSPLKVEENSQPRASAEQQNALPAIGIAEDSEGMQGQMLAAQMLVPFMDLNGNYYLQPFYCSLPTSGLC